MSGRPFFSAAGRQKSRIAILARHVSHIARYASIRRRLLNLRQSDLARHLGVGRQRIVALEQGKPNQSVDLVLQVYEALGLHLDMSAREGAAPSWVADVAWAAQRAKQNCRPRLRRSRAHLDRLRAEQAADDLKTNEAGRDASAPPLG